MTDEAASSTAPTAPTASSAPASPTTARWTWRKRLLAGCFTFCLIAGAAIVLGPRVHLDQSVRPVALPDSDLGGFIAAREAKDPTIVPGAEATIMWAGEKDAVTDVAFVYFHGFVACRQEISPVMETLAADTHSNVYFVRLAGHGHTMPDASDAALRTCTGNDWLNDAVEALAIGRRIGKKVVLVGTSTGALFPLWLALRNGGADATGIAAIVALSPNFGPADNRAEMLLWPWGLQIAYAVSGSHNGFRTISDEHARYWTHRYPVEVLPHMMSMVRLARQLPLQQLKTPTLVLYTTHDRVCNWQLMVDNAARIPESMREVEAFDARHHVPAGRILGPESTQPLIDRIRRFLDSRGVTAKATN
ncbi:MAG: alpha/beta hydrolase [Planctomycetota bacterium]